MNKDNVQSAYHKIKSLEIKGGFLDGIKIRFDNNLNCIIGGRGTGKTTVVEFIRYILGKMPDKEVSSSQYKSIDKLIRNNLGNGELRLEIETLDGLSYTLDKSLDEDMLVFDDNGKPANVSFDRGFLFNAEIYSQNEIEEIANDPYFQLKLIDKFITEEILEIERDIRAKTRDLDQNAIEILQLHKDIKSLEEQLSELPNITEKLKPLNLEEGEGAKEIRKEVVFKSIRDKEEQCIKGITEYFEKTITDFNNLNNSLLRQLEECFEEDIFKGENSDIFKSLQNESEKRIENISQKLKENLESLQSMGIVLEENKKELNIRHAKQEKKYRDLLQEYEKEKDKAKEREHLLKKQTFLLVQQKKLEKKKNELKEKKSQRQVLIKELSELRDKRYNKRNEVASIINNKLSPTIRVRIEQFGNTDKYAEILTESMKGAELRYGRIVEKITNKIPPQNLVMIIQKPKLDIESIMNELELDEERAKKIVSQLKDTKDIFDIETVELYDKPIIELKDGQDYKDSSQLSTGQKCTTILPILLLESANPLLIDQPEDNLDNAFIYETVVKSLREAKGKRQLIFVTHNPNIPVLGDAGRVFVFRSSGRKARVEIQGSVDVVKEQIETLLEGGKEAFQERKKRYGY